MNTNTTLIMLKGEDKYLSDIQDADEELGDNAKLFDDSENEVYLFEKFNIKRSLEVSERDVRMRLELTNKHFEIYDYAILPKADPFKFEFANDAIKANASDRNYYDVLMCVPPLTYYDAKNTDEVIESAISLCTDLKEYYHNFGNRHNNINHRNTFFSDGRILLGNCSLSGVKNKISWYNAPEILRGEEASVQSDVFSLGMWLYYMLHQGDNIFTQKDRAAVTDQEIRLKEDAKNYTEVIVKALSIKPENRYKNCEQFKKALEDASKSHKKAQKKRAKKVSKGGSGATILLIAAIVVIAFVICSNYIFPTISEYDPGAKEIRELISAGMYSLAYEEICARPSDEKNDVLIKEYIDACLEERDYARAVTIIYKFSQAEFDSPDYLRDLFEIYRSKDKMKLLLPVFDEIYSKSDSVAELIDRYKK